MIQEKIQELVNKNNPDAREEAESLLLNYLHQNPHDMMSWSKLAMLETLYPFEDYEKTAYYLEKAMKYNGIKEEFLIVKAFCEDWYMGGISSSTLDVLQQIANAENNEVASICNYLLYWHFKDSNISYSINLLNESINLCGEFVKNYIEMGQYYKSINQKDKGRYYILEGIKNVKKIYKVDTDLEGYDPLEINHFIGERITGIFINELNYNELKKL